MEIDYEEDVNRLVDVSILSQTAYAAFKNSLGLPVDWENLPAGLQEAWEAVATKAVPMIKGADGLAWSALADGLYAAYVKVLRLDSRERSGEPTTFQLAWEAVGRHLANVIDSDGSVELSQHEGYWAEWMRRKLTPAEQS